MNDRKFRPLRAKITSTIINVVIVALLCVGVFSLINTARISKTLQRSNAEMTQTSRTMTSGSMDEMARVRLQELADDKANLADRAFYEFRQAVSMVASAAEKVYAEQDQYPQRFTPLPDASKDGQLTMQVLYATGVDPEAPEILREAGLVGNLQETIYTVNLHSENIASVYFATESGIMVQADYISAKKFDADGNIMPLDAQTRPWYQGAASSGKPFLTSVTKDAHTPQMAIMCGVPAYYKSRLVGVAGAGMYLDSISNLVQSVNLGDKGNVCIVNNFGRILFSTVKEGELSVAGNEKDLRLSSDPKMVGLAIEALRGEHGIKQISVNGTPSFVAFAPMKTVGWSVFIILSEEEVEAPTAAMQEGLDKIAAEAMEEANATSNKGLYIFIAVLAAALLLALAASFALSKRIAEPIHELTEKVGKIQGDDLNFEWNLDTGDETQLLAESFHSLTDRMKTYVDDIQKITAEKERIGTELELATRIQTGMLPNIFPPFPKRNDIDIFASMHPAKEVGGDFYDFFLVDDEHLAFVIADVSGKGVPAALFMMASMILINSELQNGRSPAKALERVNDRICANNREEMFVTVWLGVLDLKTGKLTAANAGHEYPLVKQPGKEFELIKDKHGFVVGGMPGMKYKEYELQLEAGAKVFIYTDGVPEASDSNNELFGTDRLLDALRPVQDKAPKAIINGVADSIHSFVGDAPQFDDITMLCIQYSGQFTS